MLNKENCLYFNEKGFPSIKVFENHFEIKAVDYWEYRKFKFSETAEINHYNPNNNIISKLFIGISLFTRILARTENWCLKIKNINGGEWTYSTPAKNETTFEKNLEFKKIINTIKQKVIK